MNPRYFLRSLEYSALLFVVLLPAGCEQQAPPPPQVPDPAADRLIGHAKGYDRTEGDAGNAATTDLPPETKLAKTTLKEFLELQKQGSGALEERFGDHWIELSGPVSNIQVLNSLDGEPIPTISLVLLADDTKPDDLQNFLGMISCVVQDMKPWNVVDRGSMVTLRGVLSERGFLDQCKLMKSTGSPVTALTAKELAAAFQADPKNMDEANAKKLFVVTGRVVSNTVDNSGATVAQLVLEGTKECNVAVQSNTLGVYRQFANLKPGDATTVIGEWESQYSDAKCPVQLRDCSRCDLRGN